MSDPSILSEQALLDELREAEAFAEEAWSDGDWGTVLMRQARQTIERLIRERDEFRKRLEELSR